MSDTEDTLEHVDPAAMETGLGEATAGELVGILDQYMTDLRAGRTPDRAALLAAHPDLAAQLEACLGGIEFIHKTANPSSAEPAILGEYQIIREIGRGGMGVVYEAEQTSLKRRVALKVLRFGVIADDDATQRFRREAETVACLHHTNIVPIFAVGTERGVYFYAMQLVHGRSLAEIAAGAERSGKLASPQDVARWGLQAAEALAHAHQRGVIHRDIKPSNLLLDDEGVVWLTDFGLAKRADEVTFTVSGALMGTPRYMSPEQAESLQHKIDHRTDLYSLGATLYELATARPLFDSTTPLGMIERILNEEPKRPREIRKDLPRDLETILLTCLSKDPSKRYPSAQALADDLRAVLDGRPVQARRASLAERALRYARKQRKALGTAGIAVAVSLLLTLGAFLGWRWYADWRLGTVVLTTNGAPLAAEVLPEVGDTPITEPFAIGTKTVVPLPAGDYRLRVKGNGLMGQTYRFASNRGERLTHRLSLDEGCLMASESIPFAFASEALILTPGKADLIEWNAQSVVRRDGATGKVVWNFPQSAKTTPSVRDPATLMRWASFGCDDQNPGKIVVPAPDLDRDGTGDVVLAYEGTPSLLALSGKDGSLHWTYLPEPDGLGGPIPDPPSPNPTLDQVPRLGRTIGIPATADADGDGTPDLIVTFAVFEDRKHTVSRYGGPESRPIVQETAHPGRRVVVAVSGRSGRALWSYALDRKTTTLPPQTFEPGCAVVPGRAGAIVAFVEGARWSGLDLTTGRLRGDPIDLGFVPVRPVQHADLDGDGNPELLALGPGATARDQTLVAFSAARGRRLWAKTAGCAYNPLAGSVPLEWPLVADFDGDARAEVVIPDWQRMRPVGSYAGVQMLDGKTGERRWSLPLRPFTKAHDGLSHLVAGPDLDHDGVRDLVAISRFDGRRPFVSSGGEPLEPVRVYADAISGKDGRHLWWWSVDLGSETTRLIWPPRWWGRGPDGWPMLVLPLGGNVATSFAHEFFKHPAPAAVHVLSASNGAETHIIDGLSWPKAADLDGDGIDDLWGSVEEKLRAFRGEPPEQWRLLGRDRSAGDLDGDGAGDVVSDDLAMRFVVGDTETDSPTLIARSGRDGRRLWTSRLDSWGWSYNTGYAVHTFPTPGGDIDGDGAPDLITRKTITVQGGNDRAALPIELISGRTGRRLWSAGPLPLGFEAHGATNLEALDVVEVDGKGLPDLVVLHNSPFARPGTVPAKSTYEQTRLARISGRDGRALWDTPLAERRGSVFSGNGGFPHAFGDIDGDGGREIVLFVKANAQTRGDSVELRAISLRDGRQLWARPVRTSAFPTFVAVGDLDGDRAAEVVYADVPLEGQKAAVEITALGGRDGAPRWSWRGGNDQDRMSPQNLPIRLVDFDGKGRRDVCINVGTANGLRRVVILDSQGRERIGRNLEPTWWITLECADLNGDGREELLYQYDGRLRAADGDLKELWACPTRALIRQIIPPRSGRAGIVLLNSMTGLDAATGQPRWRSSPSREVLDTDSSPTSTRFLSGRPEETICRLAVPISEGADTRRGTPAIPESLHRDPRWTRPLPWARGDGADSYLNTFILMAVLSLVTLVVPLAVVRLAIRRRFWSVRMLMALPIAFAIPLALGLSLKSFLPPIQVEQRWMWVPLVLSVSAAGLPVLAYVAVFGSSLARRNGKKIAQVVASTALAMLVLGGLWLISDMRTMPALERYSWTSWPKLAFPAAYAVGCVLLIVRLFLGYLHFRRDRAAADYRQGARAELD